MDDIAKFLPSLLHLPKRITSSRCQVHYSHCDDLQFNNEAVEKLSKKSMTTRLTTTRVTFALIQPKHSFDELTEMRQVVEAIDASITEFDDYSKRCRGPTKYPNFSKSAITGFGDQLSYLKMELLDTYTIALQALATQCGTKTNVEAVLDGFISGKTNIVVRTQQQEYLCLATF